MTELKPCPFCGNTNSEYHSDGYACGFRCLGCGAMCGITPSKQDAIELWNTRTINKQTEITDEAVLEALSYIEQEIAGFSEVKNDGSFIDDHKILNTLKQVLAEREALKARVEKLEEALRQIDYHATNIDVLICTEGNSVKYSDQIEWGKLLNCLEQALKAKGE